MFLSNDIDLYNNIIEIVINLVLYVLMHQERPDNTDLYLPHIHRISHFGLIKIKHNDIDYYIPYTVSINNKNDTIYGYFQKQLLQDPSETKTDSKPDNQTETDTNTYAELKQDTTTQNITHTPETDIKNVVWTIENINIFIHRLCINILYFLLYTHIKLNLTHNDLKLNNIVMSTDEPKKIYIIDFGETVIRFVYNNNVYLFGKYNERHKDKDRPFGYFWYTSYFVSRPQFVDCDIYYFLATLYGMQYLYKDTEGIYKLTDAINNTSLINYKSAVTKFVNKFMLLIFHDSETGVYNGKYYFQIQNDPRILLYTILTNNDIKFKNLLLFRLYELLKILETSQQKDITALLQLKTIFSDQTINDVLKHQEETYETISKTKKIIVYNMPDKGYLSYYGIKGIHLNSRQSVTLGGGIQYKKNKQKRFNSQKNKQTRFNSQKNNQTTQYIYKAYTQKNKTIFNEKQYL